MWKDDVDFQAWLASQSIGTEVDRDLLYKAWCEGSVAPSAKAASTSGVSSRLTLFEDAVRS